MSKAWLSAGAVVLGIVLGGVVQAQTTITFMGAWGPDYRLKTVATLIAEFEQQHPDIKVNVVQPAGGWNGVEQKAQVMIAGGTAPDLLYMGETGGFAGFAAKGLLADLDPYVAESKLDLTDFFPGVLAEGRYQGRLYAIPIDSITDVYAYNMDLLQAAGLPGPAQTQDELIADAKKLHGSQEAKPIPPVRIYSPTTFQGLADFLYPNGGAFISASGQPTFTAQPVVDTLQRILDNVTQGNFQMGSSAWLQGKLPIMAAQPIDISRTLSSQVAFKVATDLIPAGPAGHVNWGLGHFLTIPASSAHKEAAWQLAAFLLSGHPDAVWHEQMNFLPSRFSVIRTEQYYQEHPIWKTFLLDLESARPLPVTPWYEDAAKAYGANMAPVFSGKAAVEQALKNTQSQVAAILADYQAHK